MRFSIVMPVYNSAQYLDAGIASVLCQEYPDWELLIIDDGSMDHSLEIINQYAAKDERLRVFHQENSGQFYARQKGIENAEGEYILFLDSDDELKRNCLSRLCEEIGTEEPDIVFFVGEIFDRERNTVRPLGSLGEKKEWLSLWSVREKLLTSDQLNSLCFKAFKRELFEGDPADYTAFRGTYYGEDKARLMYPMTKADKILYLPDVLYRYNYRPDSTMHGYDLNQVDKVLAVQLFSLLKKYMYVWGMEGTLCSERFEAYVIRTVLSAYYGLRRKCTNRRQRQDLRQYPWEEAAQIKRFRHLMNKELSMRDRIRLFLFYLRF